MSSEIRSLSESKPWDIYTIVLAILLFFPPFFGGLYWHKYWITYQLIVAVCAVVLYFLKKGKGESGFGLLDLTTGSLVLCYFLSLLVAANMQGAIGEALRVATYFVLYLLISRYTNTMGDIEKILQTLYWSGVGVTFVTIGTAFGTFNYSSAFVIGRFYSTLEYPNSFAALTICAGILGLALMLRTQKNYWKHIYTITNFLLLAGFFGSKSRGGLLTFVVIFLISLIGMPAKYRLQAIINTVFSSVIALLFVNKAIDQIAGHSALISWSYLLIACLVSTLPALLGNIASKTFSETGRAKIITYAVVAAIALVVIIGLGTGTIARAVSLPGTESLMERISKISMSSREVQERLVFYQDAIKVFKDHPILGIGGKGWDSVYHQYQGYYYATTEVHNHFLKVLVDTGIVGFLAFLGILVAFGIASVRLLGNVEDQEDKVIIWVVFCATLGLLIHSLLDFNLSIPAVSIVLWVLLGLIRAMEISTRQLAPAEFGLNNRNLIRRLSLIGLSVFAVASLVLLVSINYGVKGTVNLHDRKFAEARGELATAVSVDPFANDFLTSLAEAIMWQANDTGDEKELKTALGYVNRAIALEPENPVNRVVKAKILLILGEIDASVKEFETAYKLSPYEQPYADYLAQTYFLAGKMHYMNGDKAKAKVYLDEAAAFPKAVTDRIKKMDPRYKQLQIPALALRVTKEIESSRFEAIKLLSQL